LAPAGRDARAARDRAVAPHLAPAPCASENGVSLAAARTCTRACARYFTHASIGASTILGALVVLLALPLALAAFSRPRRAAGNGFRKGKVEHERE
jgi:hypothetical protein